MQYANRSIPTESTIENIQIYVYRPHRHCTALSAQILLNVENDTKEGYEISIYDHNEKLITAANTGFPRVSVLCFKLSVPSTGKECMHSFISSHRIPQELCVIAVTLLYPGMSAFCTL